LQQERFNVSFKAVLLFGTPSKGKRDVNIAHTGNSIVCVFALLFLYLVNPPSVSVLRIDLREVKP
jgi:hypothetical protein